MPRFGSPGQRAAVMAAIRGSGKFFRGAGMRARALRDVAKRSATSIPGRIASNVIKKTVEGQNAFVEHSSKILHNQADNLTKLSSSLFGEHGLAGKARSGLRQYIHNYAAKGKPAPIRKTTAVAASRFAEEASKVAAGASQDAIRAVHNAPLTRTGATTLGVIKGLFKPPGAGELVTPERIGVRAFSGPGRLTSGTTRKGYSRAGGVTSYSGAEGRGLRPPPTSVVRDLRHTLFGRAVLKTNKPLQKKLTNLRSFIGRATPGFKPESVGETRQNFLQARGHLGQFRAKLSEATSSATPLAQRTTARAEATRNLEEGISKFREVRRQTRSKGYGSIDLSNIGLLGVAGGVLGAKKIKDYRDEVARQKLKDIETGARTLRFERMKGYLKSQHPEWTETELHMEAMDAVTTMANVDRRLQKTEELSGFDEYNRQLTKQRIRNMQKSSPKDSVTKTPRESKLNSMKNRLKQIGTLFGTKGKPKRPKGRGKRRRK